VVCIYIGNQKVVYILKFKENDWIAVASTLRSWISLSYLWLELLAIINIL
jgi:hypothetical protein